MDTGDPIGDVELRGGQRASRGAPTPPRLAATVILLRGGARTLEVLLVRRTPRASFMGGVWVFPGGAVERGDCDARARAPAAAAAVTSEAAALRAAAVRELREEAGIELAPDAELVQLSRWITPREVEIRFDTHFFLATLPRGQEPRIDGEECVDLGWFTPQRALQASREGEIELVFPTIRHLEQLGAFASADGLLDHARGRDVHPVQPRIVLDGEVARVLLPGDPGYEK